MRLRQSWIVVSPHRQTTLFSSAPSNPMLPAPQGLNEPQLSLPRQDNNIGEYWLAISQEDFTVETA